MAPEDTIRNSLTALFEAIRTSDGEAILRETGRLDALAKEHQGVIDPRLEHFLENRSYPKALALLNAGR
jgi:hypothetical protein